VVVGLWLYNGSVLAEIFRAGINALPKGQSEAAYALGLRKTAVMKLILLPQAVKIMLPAIISQSIVALKDTSLGYAVLAPGLTYAGKQVYGEFQNIIQTALVMAAAYILCNLLLTWLATWAQRRFAGEKKIVVNVTGASVAKA
jgi:glutamate transport system permease protein